MHNMYPKRKGEWGTHVFEWYHVCCCRHRTGVARGSAITFYKSHRPLKKGQGPGVCRAVIAGPVPGAVLVSPAAGPLDLSLICDKFCAVISVARIIFVRSEEFSYGFLFNNWRVYDQFPLLAIQSKQIILNATSCTDYINFNTNTDWDLKNVGKRYSDIRSKNIAQVYHSWLFWKKKIQ